MVRTTHADGEVLQEVSSLPGKDMKKSIIVLVSALRAVVVLGGIALFSMAAYTAHSDFCASCHIMQKPYKRWAASVHGEKEVACVECHYAPGLYRHP